MRAIDSDRQPLHAMDLCVLRHSQGAGAIGCRGLTIQMQVWLQGRLDPAILRTALMWLNWSYPVVTARLVEEPKKGRAHWRFRPDATCTVHETTLASAEEGEALARAAAILGAADDPAESDAVQFHLLHRPDGRDVLLVQHDHALMDVHGTKAMLREISRLSEGLPPTSTDEGEQDGTRGYLRRFSFWQRWRAAAQLNGYARPFQRSNPVTLCDANGPSHGGTPRLAVRELDEQQTDAFLRRTTHLCGFPSPSMALLASIFRGILRHTPHPLTEASALLSSAGTNLRGRSACGPIFRNLGSVLTFMARPDDMGERDKLILSLNRQVREQTSRGTDLGLLQWVWWLRHCAGFWHRRVRRSLHQNSVNYGYMGQLVAEGDRFCGTPIDRQIITTQVWSPPALAISPSISRGRLILPAAYMAETVSEARIQAFLDTVVADLVDSPRAAKQRNDLCLQR